MSLEDAVNEVIIETKALTATVAGKVEEISQRAIAATSEVSSSIHGEFTIRTITIDPVNGPYKTIGAAVMSVPNGGAVAVKLPPSEITEFSESVGIGNRTVYISGGYSSMESDGLTPAVIKSAVYHSTTYNRSSLKGKFSGTAGGQLYFDNVKILLPVLIDGTSSEHSTAAAFLSGSMDVAFSNYGISQNMVEVDGDGTPMFLAQCGARDRKGNLNGISLSYVKIETCNSKPLINIQYGAGTLRFQTYSSVFSDKNGEAVSFPDIFYGLSYGEHGYATNLLASASLTKQVV